jgi:hypothetical protein
VRGSRRSFATHPGGVLLTPLRSRQAPVRGNGGASIQPVGAERTLANPQLRWLGSGSLAGALTLWRPCLFQPTPRRHPNSHPGSLQDGAQVHLSTGGWPEGFAAACPIRRTAQGSERIDREASLTKDATIPIPAVCRVGAPTREATGAGRSAPPAGGNRPRTVRRDPAILAFAKLPCTHPKVHAREPNHSTIRRFRVPTPE